MSSIPLSLYIHLPWCIKKCPYCDFNSHEKKGDLPEAAYIERLLDDLKTQLNRYDITRPLHSIFIGGGTPSLFSGHSIARLLDGVNALMPIPKDTEITLEANPGTVEHDHFSAYQKAGINRISLGIQSFNDAHLAKLGRIHRSAEAKKAIETVQTYFDNVNLDLMFGLPAQSIDEGLSDLETAISFAPTHLSWYQLTLEPNTVFYKERPPLPEDDDIAELYEQGQILLAKNGFKGYEISAYAKQISNRDSPLPLRERSAAKWQGEGYCKHNLNYWRFGDYLGIGAGAHGKITQNGHTILRTENPKQPTSYLKNIPAKTRTVLEKELPFEYMLNRLRLHEPFSLSDWTFYTGLAADSIQPFLTRAVNEGFLEYLSDHTYQKTPKGHLFLNDCLAWLA